MRLSLIVVISLVNTFRYSKKENQTMTSNMTVLNSLDTHLDKQPPPIKLLNQTPEIRIAKND